MFYEAKVYSQTSKMSYRKLVEVILNKKETIEKVVIKIQEDLAVQAKMNGMSDELISAHEIVNENMHIDYVSKAYDLFVSSDIFEDDGEEDEEDGEEAVYLIPEPGLDQGSDSKE